ncbi:peptidoglycan-binding protein [Methylobacterium terrae]|uniref:Peptidoglycan-binding protein n=1 Tax=Methylobacterium terrae TaxID=2202827 RepID=A0A2U8WU07_9HYPH|nr:peptidoglycan-binding domain-containing protein [Methylobacterium terrae]AWN48816.1 peptidoglycan-binding protein [Methylobacterium terrae]
MSEAPARQRDELSARRSDELSARRHDPDVALAAEARPAPRPRAAPRAPRPPRVAAGSTRPRPAGPLDRLRGRADRLMRHPAGIVGGLLVLGAVAAVAANALSFQTGRHPAPLFAKASPEKGTAEKGLAGKGPQPAAETAAATAPATNIRADAARGPGDAPSRAAKPDGIGALIHGDDPATAALDRRAGPSKAAKAVPAKDASGRDAPVREAAPRDHAGKAAPHPPVREAKAAEPKATALHAAAPASGPKPDKSVAYAQRALIKLGYGPLDVDGIAGPTTRAALARFERERRLPGASVARRTLQELEARSGLKPE